MAKTIGQQRDRQKKLIFLLVALLIATILVLYFALGLGAPSPSVSVNGGSGIGPLTSSVSQDQITSVSLDLSVLRRQEFLGLRLFGDIPIVLGELGRSNPFLPPLFGGGSQ